MSQGRYQGGPEAGSLLGLEYMEGVSRQGTRWVCFSPSVLELVANTVQTRLYSLAQPWIMSQTPKSQVLEKVSLCFLVRSLSF